MRNKIKFISGLLAVVLLLPVLVGANSGIDDSDEEREKTTEVKRELKREPKETKDIQSKETKDVKAREAKVVALRKLSLVQMNRAEKSLARLAKIMTKVEARRTKLVGSASQLKVVDDLILKAKTQKSDAEKLLADAKADQLSLTRSSDPKGTVKQFMAETKVLKKKMIELHRTMTGIVKEMKKLEKAAAEAMDDVEKNENEDKNDNEEKNNKKETE